MKSLEYKNIFLKIIMILISSFVLAITIKLIVQPNLFLSGGVSGITVLISRYISIKIDKEYMESFLYSILYVAFNIPVFIFGLKKVGKQFIYYSILNVVLFTCFVSLVPSKWFYSFQLNHIDLLTSAILAGILSGISSSISFFNGYSCGGTDIISMYLSRKKGKEIGSYNFAINVLILVAGGIMFKNYSTLIYTVIYFFVNSLVVNNLYIGQKKILIEIVTNKADEMVKRLMVESHHGCTIVNAIGAYSNQEKKILKMVVLANQTRRICEIIKEVDENSFSTLINIKQVNGNFYVPPIK